MNTERASLIKAVDADMADFLRDESRRAGHAKGICFPETEADVVSILRECASRGEPVTVQGARTGITGGAVPDGGIILNLSRMKRCGDIRLCDETRATVRIQPGLTLRELRAILAQQNWPNRNDAGFFFPPDPTETTASLGGMIACNASGALSFRYGATRNYIVGLRVALASGDILTIRRGREKARGLDFELRTESGTVVRGRLPSYRMPRVKNAAGYYAEPDMDMLDLFIGSEGTLGVVTEAELLLLPAPKVVWGVMGFLTEAKRVIELVNKLRRAPFFLAALEFFDEGALCLLRENRDRMAALQALPELKAEWKAALYVEIHADNEDAAADATLEVSRAFEAEGISDAATWSATDDTQMQRLKEFRHAVPEAVNARIDELRKREPNLTKLGTDMAVPDNRLGDVLALYAKGLAEAGLHSVQFGHIGNNHIHVNILPLSLKEYERGKELYQNWARQVVQWGGTISAEHGVGKLKKALLREMYGEQGVREMMEVKKTLDPAGILGPGTLFD